MLLLQRGDAQPPDRVEVAAQRLRVATLGPQLGRRFDEPPDRFEFVHHLRGSPRPRPFLPARLPRRHAVGGGGGVALAGPGAQDRAAGPGGPAARQSGSVALERRRVDVGDVVVDPRLRQPGGDRPVEDHQREDGVDDKGGVQADVPGPALGED